jgi:hypothetical protein
MLGRLPVREQIFYLRFIAGQIVRVRLRGSSLGELGNLFVHIVLAEVTQEVASISLPAILGGTQIPTACSYYRERLREYDPPPADGLARVYNSSTLCCISASV